MSMATFSSIAYSYNLILMVQDESRAHLLVDSSAGLDILDLKEPDGPE